MRKMLELKNLQKLIRLNFDMLVRLDLSENFINKRGLADNIVEQFFKTCEFPRLKALIFDKNSLTADGLRTIFESPGLINLKYLSVRDN